MEDVARQYKIMAKKLALLVPPPKSPMDSYRASGLCICPSCGLEYYDHPMLAEPYNWLHILCNGEYVKT